MPRWSAPSTSRNLVRVFFLQNQLKARATRRRRTDDNVCTSSAPVSWAAILPPGAHCAGSTSRLQDREMKYIEPALQRADKVVRQEVRDDDKRARHGRERLTAGRGRHGVASADLIIEAIFENLDAKQALVQGSAAEDETRRDSRHQYLEYSARRLRTVLNEPQRFIGLHFFNPVAQMMMVEVIRCEDTTAATRSISGSASSKASASCRSSVRVRRVSSSTGFSHRTWVKQWHSHSEGNVRFTPSSTSRSEVRHADGADRARRQRRSRRRFACVQSPRPAAWIAGGLSTDFRDGGSRQPRTKERPGVSTNGRTVKAVKPDTSARRAGRHRGSLDPAHGQRSGCGV